MRKITLFLSLLLICMGVAHAQFTYNGSALDLSGLATGQSVKVVLHVGGTDVNSFIGITGEPYSTDGCYYNLGSNEISTSNFYFVYTLYKVSATEIAMQDYSGKFVHGFNSGSGSFRNDVASATSADAKFLFEVVEVPVNPIDESGNAYIIKSSKASGCPIKYNSGQLAVDGTEIAFQFLEVPTTDVIINCTDSSEGLYNFSKTVDDVIIGKSISDLVTEALSSAAGTYTLNSSTEGNVTANQVIDIQLTSNYTFPVKMNTPYLMQCRYKTENGSKIFPYYMQRISDSDINTCAVSESFNLNQIWFFERVSTSPNEVVLRNMGKSVGGVYYGVTATNGKASVSANPTAYVLGIHSQNTDAITIRTAGSAYLGGHSSTVTYKGWNARLGTWVNSGAPTDPGSAFKVTEVSWEELATAAGNDKNVALASDYLTKYISADYIAALQSKSDEVTIENVARAFSDATYEFTFDTGKYYMMYSGYPTSLTLYANANPTADKVGIANGSNRGVNMTSTAPVAQALLRFEPNGNDNQYYIQHVNSGLYFSNSNNNSAVDLPLSKNYAGIYELYTSNVADDVWSIKLPAKSTYLHYPASGSILQTWGNAADVSGGSGLRIKAVDEIPVTLSSAGWSTMTLPVAVTIPSGVRAYYVTRNVGADIYVEEITGVIPANTPVLLNGTASTAYNFGITTSDATAPANNKLLGTTMARTGFSTDTGAAPDVYGLYVDETTASFVPAFSATIPANKAVLPYANIDTEGLTSEETAAMRLVFDNVTGIAGVNVNSSETDYYDLQGRRVLYPVRGQVYIKNGQKVILK